MFSNSSKDFLSKSVPEIGLFRRQSSSQKKTVKKHRTGINIRLLIAAAVVAYSTVAPAHSQAFSSDKKSEIHSAVNKSDVFNNSASVGLSFYSNDENSVESVSYASSKTSGFSKNIKLTSERLDAVETASIGLQKDVSYKFPELQKNTLEVLDANERIRLEAFKQLSRGWDFGSGEILNTSSLKNFDRFFAVGGFKPEQVATFMSNDGNLIASWPCNHGDAELEFAPSYFSYIDDSLEEARHVSIDRAADFRNELARKLHIING